MAAALQVVGALGVLAAFILSQWRIWRTDAPAYLACNLLASGLLAVLAWQGHQWGFVLLEGVWAAVSAWGLVRPRR